MSACFLRYQGKINFSREYTTPVTKEYSPGYGEKARNKVNNVLKSMRFGIGTTLECIVSAKNKFRAVARKFIKAKSYQSRV